MGYRMFIDDERYPVDDGWIIVRSYDEAIDYMTKYGCPQYISFDHDIGDPDKNGKKIANWMVERDIDSNQTWLPADFDFYVHSKNSVGGPNIELLLRPYLEHRGPINKG